MGKGGPPSFLARLRVGKSLVRNRRFETSLPALVSALEDADISLNPPKLVHSVSIRTNQ